MCKLLILLQLLLDHVPKKIIFWVERKYHLMKSKPQVVSATLILWKALVYLRVKNQDYILYLWMLCQILLQGLLE